MGYILRSIEKGTGVSLTRALLEAFAAGFVGTLTTLACMAMKIDPMWSGVIVGVSGWLGATSTIRMLEKLIYKKLGIDIHDNSER